MGSKYDQRGGLRLPCSAVSWYCSEGYSCSVPGPWSTGRQTHMFNTQYMQCTHMMTCHVYAFWKARNTPKPLNGVQLIIMHQFALFKLFKRCTKGDGRNYSTKTSGFSCMSMLPLDRLCSHDHFDISFAFFGVRMN